MWQFLCGNEGDRWHYSFVGENNTCYEISYDFDDWPYVKI